MKLWLQDSDIVFNIWINVERDLTLNEGKFVAAERFIITLMNKSYKYLTLILKNVYINNLADINNKCNDTYHSKIRIKPTDVNSRPYIYLNKEK